MAHGNIYPADKVDAALAHYFRAGNLGALRELALLWVTDRVDEELAAYRLRYGIEEPWETKERSWWPSPALPVATICRGEASTDGGPGQRRA